MFFHPHLAVQGPLVPDRLWVCPAPVGPLQEGGASASGDGHCFPDWGSPEGGGALDPIQGRWLHSEQTLLKYLSVFSVDMGSENKTAGRDLMVSAFSHHSGAKTVTLLRASHTSARALDQWAGPCVTWFLLHWS